MRIEHVGSTSVRGLPAKPIIDIVLEVKDSADEGLLRVKLDTKESRSERIDGAGLLERLPRVRVYVGRTEWSKLTAT